MRYDPEVFRIAAEIADEGDYAYISEAVFGAHTRASPPTRAGFYLDLAYQDVASQDWWDCDLVQQRVLWLLLLAEACNDL